jgi:NAD(P)-dependent dehydrogenase (short-subunit alcohol dehydrogenase family)
MGLRTGWHELMLQRRLHRGSKSSPGVALVTGANKGIGLEVVRQLAGEGWRVFLTARNYEKGTEAASTLGTHVTFVQMDVTSETSIARAAAEVSQQTEALDLLINNAGVLFREQDQSVLDVSLDILRQCWETNCLGPLMVTRAFLPLLRKSGTVRVVNVSSEMGRL